MNHPDEELDIFDFEPEQEEYVDKFAGYTDEPIEELYFLAEQNELLVDPML